MRTRSLLVLVTLLWGCPADSPLDSSPDGSTEADMSSSGDMGQQAEVTLSTVSPSEGPIEGGTAVTLSGSGFVPGMTVRFGSGAAVDPTVTSSTEATATTPASPTAGAVTVVVQTPDGAIDSLSGGFTYTGNTQPTGSIDFCQLQAQSPASATTGEASDALFAVVFAEGITSGGGQGTGIEAELGWGSDDAYEQFNFVPTSYNVDIDGLTAGDLANDEYGAPLTITEAGTYRYVARFKISSEATWTYCDLDGSENGVSPDQLGTLEVTDPATPIVGFCRTETQLVRAQTNSASDSIRGVVFVAGATPGAGAGSNVIGEIAYGPATDAPDTWTTLAASYEGDADGLTPGDLANDAWSGTITATMEGDYGFAFRFSADGGTTWTLCDNDGTTDGSDFDGSAVGSLEVSDVLVELADACNLQFPNILEAAQVGTPIEFFGRITEAGLTGSGSGSATLIAELLVGPIGADPTTDIASFTTVGASVNTNTVNLGAGEDEYVASFTPTSAGEYAFGFRFSVDAGANWSYCGMQDEANPSGLFTTSRLGTLSVSAASPDTVDFCHVWQDTLTDDADGATLPTVTVEVFEDPTTVGNGGANSAQIEVEAAAIAVELNPALAGANWNPITYKALRVGFPNNYEYEGTAYTPATHPTVGSYNVVARARPAGGAIWTYCDTDEAASEFRLDAATPLTVTP